MEEIFKNSTECIPERKEGERKGSAAGAVAAKVMGLMMKSALPKERSEEKADDNITLKEFLREGGNKGQEEVKEEGFFNKQTMTKNFMKYPT